MAVLEIASAAAASISLNPPGALWFDALFGYGSLALLIALVIWQKMNAADPPRQD